MSSGKQDSNGKKQDLNGNGAKMYEFLGKAFSNNPALLLAALFTLWASGRIQTPEENKSLTLPLEMKIEVLTAEVQSLKSEMKTHDQLGGHMRMEFRMEAMEKWVEIQKKKGNVSLSELNPLLAENNRDDE